MTKYTVGVVYSRAVASQTSGMNCGVYFKIEGVNGSLNQPPPLMVIQDDAEVVLEYKRQTVPM